MGMILEYDQSPNATVDQKVSTLKDSVQRALEDVEQNTEGRPGAPGVGIEEIIEQWLLSTSKISPIGTWVYTEDRPDWKPNHYFWTRNEVHYTDGNIRFTTPGLADALNRAYEAAYEAGEILGDIEVTVSTIEQTVEEITQLADESKELAQQAQSAAEDASEQVGQVSAEIAEANRQIGILVGELETLESTMEASYATKGELTEISTSLGTQIQQNAAQISSTASAVQQVDIDATQALQDAAAAATAAAQAQQNATDAQNKYTQLKQQADVTDEQLEAAKEAVEEAQKAATEAGDAAAAAQSAVGSLTDRVTAAETNITQNANQISQTAEKIDNLKIGGRNLLKYTGNMPIDSEANGTDGISRYNNSYGTLTDTGDGLKLTFAGNVNACMSVPLIDDGVVENGEEVTLSFKYRGNITNPGAFFFLQRTTPNIAVTTLPVNYPLEVSETEWKEYAATFSHNEANIRTCYQVLLFQGLSGYDNTNWIEIKKNTLKLEKGNRATDWTPATEDQTEQITEAVNEASSQILQTAEEITMGILSGYTTESDLAEYKQEIQNLFSVTNEGFSFEFSQLEQKITELGDDVVQKNQFIRLENGNIIIGKSDSPIQAKFTNNSLEFMYNDVTVAKFTNEVLEVRNIRTENQVAFGDNWAIRPGTGDNLNIVWTGG